MGTLLGTLEILLLSYAQLFKPNYGIRLVKWSFTWLLALLPILFLMFKQFLSGTDLELTAICATGEFFLVGIVMVAEPLGDVITSGRNSMASLMVVVASVMLIASSTYVFSVVNAAEENHGYSNSTTNCCGKPSCNSEGTVVPLQVSSCAAGPVNVKNETNTTQLSIDIKKKRLKALSICFILISLFVGFVSVCIANLSSRLTPRIA